MYLQNTLGQEMRSLVTNKTIQLILLFVIRDERCTLLSSLEDGGRSFNNGDRSG